MRFCYFPKMSHGVSSFENVAVWRSDGELRLVFQPWLYTCHQIRGPELPAVSSIIDKARTGHRYRDDAVR